MSRVNRLLAGKTRAGSEAGALAPPSGRGSGAESGGIQERRPGDGFWQSGDVAKHDFDDMADGVGGIDRAAGPLEAPVNEQLKQIEGQRPKQQDGQDGIGRMPEDMAEIPVLDPLVEGGVFNVPAGPNDFQGGAAAQVAGAFADDREAPRCGVRSSAV